MFVTFEGSEGSGKSTQIALLSFFLRQQGYKVLTTREPGGTRIGDQIRSCLHDVANKDMTSAAEVLLYSASRAQHVQELIQPALASQHIVLCDRYADSTLAYQGYGRGHDLTDLARITRFATGGLKPDLTFLLDIEARTGLGRRSSNQLEMNRMDQQSLDFYKKVRAGYMELAAAEPRRWVIVDAGQSVDDVQSKLRQAILSRLGPT